MSPLSIVVPTRDRPERLARCLAAIDAERRPEDEVIVVDSASAAPVNGPAWVRVIRCADPGASRARNRGWRLARHQLVAFVDDDVSVSAGWADALAAAFAAHPEAAFVAGRVGLAEGVRHDRPVAFLDSPTAKALDLGTRTGDLGHTANLAVRRTVLEEVAGFDELMGAGERYRAAEDLDLVDRILLASHGGWYEPAAAATHDQWRTRWELVRLDYGYGIGGGVRIAKLGRGGARKRARRELSVALWEYGVAQVPHHAVRGHKFLTLTPLARVAGTLIGVGVGWPAAGRLDDHGHLLGHRPR